VKVGARVLICDPIPDRAVAAMREGGLEVDERTDLATADLTGILGGYDAVVVRSATTITREHVQAAAGRLRLVVRGGVGVDNIDVAAAEQHGIRVLNTPGASTVSVAELALGLMFALARRVPQADASVKSGQWDKKSFSKGVELEGKTLGIIGLGRIGTMLARKASAIGLHAIAAYDKYRKRAESEGAAALTTKADLLRQADIISLHIPFDPASAPELGSSEFARMKHGVFLVNCARGGVVDEAALLDALESGKVAGAALDVFATEPPTDLRLLRHPSVICTPHIGAATIEGQGRVGSEVAQILLRELGA
jgi:D-3-phosphoglycerate dehydrogenase